MYNHINVFIQALVALAGLTAVTVLLDAAVRCAAQMMRLRDLRRSSKLRLRDPQLDTEKTLFRPKMFRKTTIISPSLTSQAKAAVHVRQARRKAG